MRNILSLFTLSLSSRTVVFVWQGVAKIGGSTTSFCLNSSKFCEGKDLYNSHPCTVSVFCKVFSGVQDYVCLFTCVYATILVQGYPGTNILEREDPSHPLTHTQRCHYYLINPDGDGREANFFQEQQTEFR